MILIAFLLGGKVIAQNLNSIPKCHECDKSENIVLHKWQCVEDTDNTVYMFHFDNGVYRLNQAFRILDYILTDNGLRFDQPDKDNTYISSIVDGWSDYSSLDLTILTGASYTSRLWEIPNENGSVTYLFLQMNEEYRVIVVSVPN